MEGRSPLREGFLVEVCPKYPWSSCDVIDFGPLPPLFARFRSGRFGPWSAWVRRGTGHFGQFVVPECAEMWIPRAVCCFLVLDFICRGGGPLCEFLLRSSRCLVPRPITWRPAGFEGRGGFSAHRSPQCRLALLLPWYVSLPLASLYSCPSL